MEYKHFNGSKLKVSEVGMGTYYGPGWIAGSLFGARSGSDRKIEAIKTGIEHGMNLIDTAEIYGSEPLIKRAIGGCEREELFIATKVWWTHLEEKQLIGALEKSMLLLGVDYIDLYQIHFPSRSVEISQTVSAIEKLMDQGKVRQFGVSNFSLKQLMEARDSMKKHDVSSVQLSYSLMDRRVENEILPYCQKNSIEFLAYYPLGSGRLAADQRLDEICKRYKKTNAQVALNWLTTKKNVFAIPRASNAPHVIENAEASGWKLSQKDIALLDKLYEAA